MFLSRNNRLLSECLNRAFLASFLLSISAHAASNPPPQLALSWKADAEHPVVSIQTSTHPYGRYTLRYTDSLLSDTWHSFTNGGVTVETAQSATHHIFLDDGTTNTSGSSFATGTRFYQVVMDSQKYVGGTDYALYSDNGSALDISNMTISTVPNEIFINTSTNDGGFELSNISAFPDSGAWTLASPGGGAQAHCNHEAAHSGSNGLWAYTGTDAYAHWSSTYQTHPASEGDLFSAEAYIMQPPGIWGTWVTHSRAFISLRFLDVWSAPLLQLDSTQTITYSNQTWQISRIEDAQAPAGTTQVQLSLIVEKPADREGVSVAAFDDVQLTRLQATSSVYHGNPQNPEGGHCIRLGSTSSNSLSMTYKEGESRNFSFYTNGYLSFWLKTLEATTVAIEDTSNTVTQVSLPPTKNAAGRLTWQHITIPISTFTNVDINQIICPFRIMCSAGTNACEVDYVRWTMDPLTRPAAPLAIPSGDRRVQIYEEHFYVDGELFIPRCSLYEYHPYGTIPWETTAPDSVFRRQMRELKDAGFNTIRWYNTKTNGLAICAEEGMMVIVQLWLHDDIGLFSDPVYRAENMTRMRGLVQSYAPYNDAILGYVLMNEPQYGAIDSGAQLNAFHDYLAELTTMIYEEDPGAAVSLADWITGDSFNHQQWDFTCFNAYDWSFSNTTNGMGFRPYIETLRKQHAAGKPFILLEYGRSVSPTAQNPYGYGGNTEQQQSDYSMAMLKDALAAGCSGFCYTHYADMWWRDGDENVHDDHPEEWFGMWDLTQGGGPEMEGRWRPVYYAHSNFYRGFMTEPRADQTWQGKERILVNSEQATSVTYRIDTGAWQPLTNNEVARWWSAMISSTNLSDGIHSVETQIAGPWHPPITNQAFITVANQSIDTNKLCITVTPSALQVSPDQTFTTTIAIQDLNGCPVTNRPVNIGIIDYTGWSLTNLIHTTDSNGSITLPVTAPSYGGLLKISAGTEFEQGTIQRRFGGMATIRVGIW